MTILSVVQDVSNELGLPTVSTVIGNTDLTVTQLLATTKRSIKEARQLYDWPQLTKETTITLVSAQANYALAADFNRFQFDTVWDRTNKWMLVGGVTPQVWQYDQSGITNITPRKTFRVKSILDNQFYIYPTPSSGEAGGILAYEYQSRTVIRPVTWTASTAFAASSWSFYNGNIYQTTSGGTTGSTAPTHTTGSASDGGVTWAYSSAAYETFVADTDVCLIDENCITMDVKWRFMQQKGMDYLDLKLESQQAMKRFSTNLRAARTLRMCGESPINFLSSNNLPDSGFGT